MTPRIRPLVVLVLLCPALTRAQDAPAQQGADGAAPHSARGQAAPEAAPTAASAPRTTGVRDAAPPVAQVVRMALAAAQSSDPARTRELARRARLSGLLPTLRVGAERSLKQNLSAVSGDSERTNASLGDGMALDATLTFDLPRLVFASEEVRLLSVNRWLAQDRRKLVKEVVQLYFQRRRLLEERAASKARDPELDLALSEVEALLDALTDGAFSAALGAAAAPR